MSRDPDRIPEILASLQLLYNIFQTSDSLSELYNTEDWQVAMCIQEHLRETKK